MTDAQDRAGGHLARLLAEPLEPGLYLVATPIGNLADITLRALAVLARADMVLCEDTRHSRILLAHFALDRALQPYHEHNAERQRPRVLAQLQRGRSVALISDAGTPLISDPGYKLVREARDRGLKLFAVPGPSAAVAALTVAGLPTDSFFFAGFLPARDAARRRRLEALAVVPGTLVFYDAAARLAASLKAMGEAFPGREAAIARELTKRHEEVITGTLSELADRLGDTALKGEIVLLVAPPAPEAASDNAIRRRLATELRHASLRDAVQRVAKELKANKKRVYTLALDMRQGRADHGG